MAEARVSINLKEGVIELQGPIEFVQRYLEIYAPLLKGSPAETPKAEAEVTQKKAQRSATRQSSKKKITCSAAIRSILKDGFLDEPRSTGDIKKRLAEDGFTFTDSNVRSSLKRLTDSKALNATGKGSTLRYIKVG